MKTVTRQTDWTYLAREAFLLLACAYVILLGGGFSALVDFRLQAASTILAIVVFGIWLVVRLRAKSKLTASGIDWAILLFLASQFIAVASSEDPRRSLPHAILWLVYVLVFYLTLDLLRRGWPKELFAKCLLIAVAMVLAFSAVELAQLYSAWRANTAGLEFFPSFQQRLSAILGDPNLLAALANLVLPLALAAFLTAKNRILQIALAFYMGLNLLILYFTDSRGGLLGMGTAVGSFLLLWIILVSKSGKVQVRRWAHWLWQRKVLLLVLVTAVLLAVGYVGWRFLSFEGSATHARVANARDIYWQAGINAFTEDPVTGAGPGMYPIYLMKIWSTPPARPYLHAHGLPFHAAAESGILGLAGHAVLLFALVRRAWGAWRHMDPNARGWWVAAAAGLLGLTAHSVVDVFYPFPAVGVIEFVFWAFLIYPGKQGEKPNGLNPWLIAVPGLLAAAFTLYCLNAYWHADMAVTAGSRGDWQTAAAEMQTAAEVDPGMAFYWLQAGYAYGRLAETDPQFVDEAIAAYQKGIEIEPEYALSRANLGAMLWAAGYESEALHQMRIATSVAPESWILFLNEGTLEEELEQTTDAMSSYTQSLGFNPQISGSNFWDASELRQEALQTAMVSALLNEPGGDAASLVSAAREEIAQTNFDSAQRLLGEAFLLNDQYVRLYVGLAEMAKANGDLALGEQYVRAALGILSVNNQPKVEALLVGAEISLASNDREEALQRFETAFNAIFAETSYGWGSSGWSPYAWFVFQRRAFPEDLLPQLERADITTDLAARLLPLADLYEEMGEQQKAEEVRQALASYLP